MMSTQKEKFYTESKSLSENSVGEVYINRVSEKLGSKDLKAYFVTFKNGARTRVHYHDSDQILIAHNNGGFVSFVKGIIQTQDGKWVVDADDPITLDEGESISIPAGKLHTHGARQGVAEFSHVAILKNGNTVWF